MKWPAIAALLFTVQAACAAEVPVPKMLQGEKGRYRVEVLEGGGRMGPGSKITVCSDNLLRDAGARADASCEHKLVRDDADQAVVESACKERAATLTLTRDGKSVLMTLASTGPRGARNTRMRFTHLGECHTLPDSR
jgi:hypothetical protein